MTATPLVVLDACVLANFSSCDTLLRIAEPPRLFEPKWSKEIIRETTRTSELRLGRPNSLTAHFENELRATFGEAWIGGYESPIPEMTNDEKDRHVVAAAVQGNVKPSPLRSGAFGTVGCPGDAPADLLHQQASDRGRTLRQLVDILNATVPHVSGKTSRG